MCKWKKKFFQFDPVFFFFLIVFTGSIIILRLLHQTFELRISRFAVYLLLFNRSLPSVWYIYIIFVILEFSNTDVFRICLFHFLCHVFESCCVVFFFFLLHFITADDLSSIFFILELVSCFSSSPASTKDRVKNRCLSAQDVPGPYAFPILGTRWIFSWFGYYQINKIHDAYKGKETWIFWRF